MNIEAIEKVAAVLKASPHLTELEVREGELSLRLRRTSATPPSPASTPRPVARPTTVPASSTTATVSPVSSASVWVKAQVVGVFHTNLTVGDEVRAGQVIGQIEAMRLMNDCVAPITGTIESIAVSDRQPVEYGQALFALLPTPENAEI
jgi:acetyl-CoA carboxylase biotin carboxyl carrier protein